MFTRNWHFPTLYRLGGRGTSVLSYATRQATDMSVDETILIISRQKLTLFANSLYIAYCLLFIITFTYEDLSSSRVVWKIRATCCWAALLKSGLVVEQWRACAACSLSNIEAPLQSWKISRRRMKRLTAETLEPTKITGLVVATGPNAIFSWHPNPSVYDTEICGLVYDRNCLSHCRRVKTCLIYECWSCRDRCADNLAIAHSLIYTLLHPNAPL